MSLRARLALYFALLVVLPLGIAAVTARSALVADLERRAGERLEVVVRAVADRVELARLRTSEVAVDLASRGRPLGDALVEGDAGTVQRLVREVAARDDRVDVVVVLDASGRRLGSLADPAQVPPEVSAPPVEEIAAAAAEGEVSPFLLGSLRPVVSSTDGRELGTVLAGRWVDAELARDLQRRLAADVTLLVSGRLAGSTVADLTAGDVQGLEGSDRVVLGERDVLARVVDAGSLRAVVSEPAGPVADARSVIDSVTLGLLAVVALAGGVLSWRLAESVTSPLQQVEAAARSLAAGNLDLELEARGDDEVATLARAFNAMAANLRDKVTELEDSHSALKQSLSWMGRTLSSSLDLNRTLAAVVDASMESLRAEAAALYMLRPGQRELYVKVARHLPDGLVRERVEVGAGLVGWVAQTGSSACLPRDAGSIPVPSGEASRDEVALLVPLFNPQQGDVLGVLALYGRTSGGVYTPSDVHTLESFASQASVAIENVRLHRLTEQASVTDSLTGLWNLRYFERRAEEEVERATRFGHHLALLVADIDHFKAVNDRFGHPAGDRVLVEVSRRMGDEVREVDTLARIGGEELVLVLPETSVEGALQTAGRIRRRVGASPIATGVGEVTVTISLGVAAFPQHGTTAAELLRAADRAMYAAKAAGRDRVMAATIEARETARG